MKRTWRIVQTDGGFEMFARIVVKNEGDAALGSKKAGEKLLRLL